jgi:exodeoxyribonuclease VII large subunit
MIAPQVPEGVTVLSVSELNQAVKEVMETGFPAVWVSGEVSNFTRHSSGHWYLTLKDAKSQLKTVVYRGVNLRLRFDLREGMEVIARGRLSVYTVRGDYQLAVEELHPKGIGAADLALRQSRDRLRKLGYFEPSRKQPLPKFPTRVALITSPTGAAVRDLVEILGRRWPAAEVVVRPTRVQGEGAAEDVALALRQLNALHKASTLPLDVIIIGRGGGSIEDLWAFNEEEVAHAVFASAVPVVSAVGHETDVTTADLVADVRATTPTHAATLATPDRMELIEALQGAGVRMQEVLRQRLTLARKRLDELAVRPALRRPLDRVRTLERQLDEWDGRLRRAVRARLQLLGERLTAVAGRLEGLSPLNVLARGYTLTRTETGPTLVRDASQVRPGDRLRTTLARGEVISRVEEVRPGGPKGPAVTDDDNPAARTLP